MASCKNDILFLKNFGNVIIGEGVGTSNFRTSTGQKSQNVEMVFLVDQNIEIRTSKMSFELIRTPTIRTSKIALKIKN